MNCFDMNSSTGSASLLLLLFRYRYFHFSCKYYGPLFMPGIRFGFFTTQSSLVYRGNRLSLSFLANGTRREALSCIPAPAANAAPSMAGGQSSSIEETINCRRRFRLFQFTAFRNGPSAGVVR